MSQSFATSSDQKQPQAWAITPNSQALAQLAKGIWDCAVQTNQRPLVVLSTAGPLVGVRAALEQNRPKDLPSSIAFLPQVISFTDWLEAAPGAWLTAPTWNWGPYYIQTAKSVADGTCPTDEYYGNMKDGMVTLASFGESVDAETQSLIEEKKAATVAGEFGPFTGPINKQDGSAWLADGEKAELGFLLGEMTFFVEGVVGSAKG